MRTEINNLFQPVFSAIQKHDNIARHFLTITCSIILLTSCATAQPPVKVSGDGIRVAAPVVALAAEPPAKLIMDAPLPGPLTHGRVVVQYRTENLRILAVFGEAALNVSPRIGHLHITLDDLPWRWLDTSNEPITINGLPAGQHHILVQMVGPTHKVIDSKIVTFIVPEVKEGFESHH